ncbi:MAG: glycoside hydrolase family 38 C-terminal domain-containing protein [Dehalococcoidia bacterium]
MTTEAGTRRYIVVSHTHWDREWYLPFEAFRARLVRMMDSLIELFDSDAGFKHFVLDGQTVPLDDYLEIRPERRETIERLVRDGRLVIGPNYILPDEFLIGAEAWVRNLMVGIRSAREYGAVMNVGYSPDAFGHIAHLPAILRGFGIDSVAIWRGVGNDVKVSEFRWGSPDGSEVLAIHFPYGYGYMSEVPEDREALANTLANVRSMLDPLATTRNVLVPNGTDHLPAHSGLSGVIRTANELLDGSTMEHGTYPQFVAAVREELGDHYNDLPLLVGEFRSSDRSNVLAGVLSARMWLKQRYAYCEDLLARYAEPLAAWSHLLRGANGAGGERTAEDRRLLQHAWKLLLQNGPHDSVTGCSADAVYDDVGLRFNKCEQIAEQIIFASHQDIAEAAAPPGETCALVWNPLNVTRTDFCTVRIPVRPGEEPTHAVYGAGNAAPLQAIERGGYSPVDPRERVTFGFVASDVTSLGYKVFRLERREEVASGMAAGNAIENEFFRVTGEGDGTLTVEDKRDGRVLCGLNRFLDVGDRGDEYTYNPPDEDQIVDRATGPVSVAVMEAGPVRWTLEVRQTYRLPVRLTGDRGARSEEEVDCEIVSRVSLYPGVARVDIETDVDNRAEDHRLRVLFPSGVVTDMSDSEQHFGVVRRPVACAPEPPNAPESPVAFYPQKTFTDLSDGAQGLMIANRGLAEYEVMTEDDGTATLAVTLLRCVSWLSRDDLSKRRGHAGPGMHTPGAQMIGRWSFEYSIVPHEGGWQRAYIEAHAFNRPLRALRTNRGKGQLPREKSLVTVSDPALVVSTVKLAEDDDSVVVRAFNIADQPIEAGLTLDEAHGAAQAVDLNEENAAPVDAARMALRRNQIVTLKFPQA